MADYYTMASFEIPLRTPEESAWAHQLCAIELDGDPANVRVQLEALGIVTADLGEAVLPDQAGDWGYWDFEMQVITVPKGGGSLWIHAWESFDTTTAAEICRAFLARFEPKGCIVFEWANSCSKPRLDAYGGGGCCVTAEGAEWTSTWRAVSDLAAKSGMTVMNHLG